MSKSLYLKGVKALTNIVVREASRSHSYPKLPEATEPAEGPTPQQIEKTSRGKVQLSEAIDMPTTAETVDELRRRLAKELYRMELDLVGGGRIPNRACDV